ncbi:ribonuclease [Candidatus Fermentibacteria bacterium]|nr:MAG: ribonuclease [Candidatus Fermentibacteria bacterium]
MTRREKSIFVLDTNVVLHDHSCLDHFQEHDVVIPITVLEELDSFKKGNDSINFSARSFIRQLDELAGEGLPADGVSLGEKRGNLFVIHAKNGIGSISNVFTEDTPDHRIISVAAELHDEDPRRNVVLISKDINLRMKAIAVGLAAEDYITDKTASPDELYTGSCLVEGASAESISALYDQPYSIPGEQLPLEEEPVSNQFFIIRNGSMSALACHSPEDDQIHRVRKRRAFGIDPRNAEQAFALHALLDPDIQLVTLTGKAGTGKTLLALASSLELRKRYRQIYLARPVVPLSNRDMGYLPGDIQSKLDPYMQPLWDNLAVIRNSYARDSHEYEMVRDMVDSEKLIITPLAYIRGRSLNKVFFIVDEAQNLTPHEVKTIITRAGEGTKFVFTGDIYQIDTPYLDSRSNGLAYLVSRMTGQSIYAHVNLVRGERSQLAELASDIL